MKVNYVLLISLLIVGALFIPAVSAYEIIYDETMTAYTNTSKSGGFIHDGSNHPSGQYRDLLIKDISLMETLSYIIVEVPGNQGSIPESTRHVTTYTIDDITKPAYIYCRKNRNLVGSVTSTTFTIFLDQWDITGKSGQKSVKLNNVYLCSGGYAHSTLRRTEKSPDIALYAYVSWDLQNYYPDNQIISHASATTWTNRLKVTEEGAGEFTGHAVSLKRTIDGKSKSSRMMIFDTNNTAIYDQSGSNDIELWYPKNTISLISIYPPSGAPYNYSITVGDDPGDPDDPGDAAVTVYVKNSQTGALIADANVAIDALVNGEYYPITNRTEPSGIFSINLQPTGGGQPNPDSYRLIVTADGYNNPMPEINFTVDDYKLSIYCLLDPIAGGPVNENKTFIDFFVRDMSSNPIPGATVKFGKYTLITNSAGYTVFEVDKNNVYTWTISKSGYGPLTGNAVIGDAPRHTINTVLAPAVTPTKPTPIPTSPPIGPTPTMTAPTGETVSNWLEWFAAHFGMILGGGVEIGKIFMWLCFTVPVGVYVGKEAKAGAAGFMAGAGIVTLFFVLIGWVPIWLLVLLALIIGLLYAKVFNSQDNGGGGR